MEVSGLQKTMKKLETAHIPRGRERTNQRTGKLCVNSDWREIRCFKPRQSAITAQMNGEKKKKKSNCNIYNLYFFENDQKQKVIQANPNNRIRPELDLKCI